MECGQWVCLYSNTPIPFSTFSAGGHFEFLVATGDLLINTVRVSDSGNYTCTASNLVGVASAMVEVVVRGQQ